MGLEITYLIEMLENVLIGKNNSCTGSVKPSLYLSSKAKYLSLILQGPYHHKGGLV